MTEYTGVFSKRTCLVLILGILGTLVLGRVGALLGVGIGLVLAGVWWYIEREAKDKKA